MVLPQIIEVTPQRLVPFDHAVCPGEQTFKNVTYTINRPSVLEIDAVVYDVNKARPIPTTALSSSRPSPYAMSQTMGFTFTVPNLPKGDYEFQVGVSPKNQSSVTAFWVIPFSVAVGCPTPVPPPSPTEVGGNKGE